MPRSTNSRKKSTKSRSSRSKKPSTRAGPQSRRTSSKPRTSRAKASTFTATQQNQIRQHIESEYNEIDKQIVDYIPHTMRIDLLALTWALHGETVYISPSCTLEIGRVQTRQGRVEEADDYGLVMSLNYDGQKVIKGNTKRFADYIKAILKKAAEVSKTRGFEYNQLDFTEFFSRSKQSLSLESKLNSFANRVYPFVRLYMQEPQSSGENLPSHLLAMLDPSPKPRSAPKRKKSRSRSAPRRTKSRSRGRLSRLKAWFK